MKTPMFILVFCLISCTKIDFISEQPEKILSMVADSAKGAIKVPPAKATEANVSIDYEFPHSGDITAKGISGYMDFYNKYISGRILTPKTYSINFVSINLHTEQTVAGEWGNKQLVSLAPDKYFVYGVSHPTKFPVCGDTCYLRFHDTIDITQTSTNITLKAYYDCSLILLDTTDVKSTKFFADTTKWTFYDYFYKCVKKTMMKTENLYHSFYSNGPANGDGYDKTQLYLNVVSRRVETVPSPTGPYTYNRNTTIILWLYTWTAGRYYYFEDTNDNYTLLPPMTNGSN